MLKHLGLISGIMISGLGLFFILMYINVLLEGYSFLNFVKLISKTFECYFFLIGIIIIIISIERIKR